MAATTEQSKTTMPGRAASADDSGTTADTTEGRASRDAQDRFTAGERRAAEITSAGGPDPFPPYDLMTLDELRATAAELGVTLPPDTEKSLWVTELRAHRSGGLSVARKRDLS